MIRGLALFAAPLLASNLAAASASVQLPVAKAKVSATLASIKTAENQEKWDRCAGLAARGFAAEPRVKGWILSTWLRCARKAETKSVSNKLSRAALAAYDREPLLRAGPWEKSLHSEHLKTRFQVVEKEIKEKPGPLAADLDRLLEGLDGSDRDSRARAYGLYGEWAFAQRDFEAAKQYFDQSLSDRENRSVREKYAQTLLALNAKSEAKPENPAEEFMSEGERRFEERFASAQKSNDLLALIEDCVAYLNRFPQGKRAKWAHDKVMDLYFHFLEQAQGSEEKWTVLRDRTLSLMEKTEWSRLGEWSRLLHRRGDFNGSLRLAEKALASTGTSSWGAILQYVAGRSAQMLGDHKRAQKHLESYAESASAGDDIDEVLFRLGLVHLRQDQPASAVAVFERLLSLKGRDRYELVARYWMIRALQKTKSPRVGAEIETLTQKFPFSYYGLKLRAEGNQGVLEWPYPLETSKTLKGKLALTGPQKKSWDRIRELSAAGWRAEALAEISQFPIPQEGRMKALLAQAWNDGQAYPVVIRLLNQATDESVDFRTRDLIMMGLPKDFAGIVEGEAKKYGLQSILVWSLIRQESAFNPKAVSTSNALGLMQLIPPTAREVAGQLKLGELDLPDDVFNPERNIPMGTSYLAKMIRQFRSSVPVGLAAYNAGPTRMNLFVNARADLKEQILKAPEGPFDELWMDELPWYETSFYVKAILRNTLMYRLLDQRRVTLETVVWKDLIQNPGSAAPTASSAAFGN